MECVFGELQSGARNGRETAALESYWKSLPKLDESGIWIEAGKLSASRRLHARGVGLQSADDGAQCVERGLGLVETQGDPLFGLAAVAIVAHR